MTDYSLIGVVKVTRLVFYPRGASYARILAVVVCLCVCLCVSVCLSHAGIELKRLNVGSRKQRHVMSQGLFPDAKSRWWTTPFP